MDFFKYQQELNKISRRIDRELGISKPIVIESKTTDPATWAVYKEVTESTRVAFGFQSAEEAQKFANQQKSRWAAREEAGITAPKYYIVREV